MAADALHNMRDLVNHHMGQHRTGTLRFFDAIEEHRGVSALVG